MYILLLILFFASILCLIIGLVKPSVLSRFIKGEITRKRIAKVFGIATIVFIILFGITNYSSKSNEVAQQPTTKVSEKEIKMLWDIPMIMNKSHNQIVEILGNPTTIQELSEGKSRLFKFKGGEKQLILEENLPARLGIKTTEYDVSYKQSDCGMMVCGNDLSYSYTNSDQSVKYFFIDNYPVENPTFSATELKQIGNLNGTTTIKVIPYYVKQPRGMVLIGLNICDKNYKGSEYEDGSENCSK
jgi:hypothetical protein